MKNTPYKYATWQENVAISATALAGLGAYTAGLLITFNPWVVAGVGLYAGYYFTTNLVANIPFMKDKMLQSNIKKGECSKLENYKPIVQMAIEAALAYVYSSSDSVERASVELWYKKVRPYVQRFMNIQKAKTLPRRKN